MTAVFDPPTEESTDLDTERWEVQTSVPVAVTAPPNVDFILTSHAEQAAGDFPIELSNPQELFDQLLDYARREMGLSSVSSGILFRNGVPVTGYVDNRSLQNETASQALRSLLSSFVVESSGIQRMAQRALVEERIEQFPLPTFGSPPSGWATVGQVATSGTCAVFAGYATLLDQPLMACIGSGTAFALWFLKPIARVARRSFTERAARWIGAEVRPEDLT